MKLLPTLRRDAFGRHACLGFGTEHTVAAIHARLADEATAAHQLAAYHDSVARQREIRAAMDAPTDTFPVIDAEIVEWQDPALVVATAVVTYVDPEPTLPVTRAELMGGAR